MPFAAPLGRDVQVIQPQGYLISTHPPAEGQPDADNVAQAVGVVAARVRRDRHAGYRGTHAGQGPTVTDMSEKLGAYSQTTFRSQWSDGRS